MHPHFKKFYKNYKFIKYSQYFFVFMDFINCKFLLLLERSSNIFYSFPSFLYLQSFRSMGPKHHQQSVIRLNFENRLWKLFYYIIYFATVQYVLTQFFRLWGGADRLVCEFSSNGAQFVLWKFIKCDMNEVVWDLIVLRCFWLKCQ